MPKGPYTADQIGADLCEALVATDISLKKVEHPVLCKFLESHHGITLPHETTFNEKFMPACHDEVMDNIKAQVKKGPLWISADCSRDSRDWESANATLGRFNSERYYTPSW